MRSLMVVKLFAAAAIMLLWAGSSTAIAPANQPRMHLLQETEIKEIRISAIPDSDAKKVEEKCNLVAEALGKHLGLTVKFMPQQDYAACVTGIATGQLELVWFGGVTGVQTNNKMGDKCTFVACRDVDKKYKTYFIANKDSKIGAIKNLTAISENENAGEWTFTFGSKSSTSGHVMPRHFFQEQTGEKPEDVFKSVAYSGSHDATLRNVANGTATVGAMNYKSWDTAKAEDLVAAKEKCEIIYTTPDYADYVWVANNRVGADILKKMTEWFTGLDPKKEADNKILEAWGTKDGKFVTCEKKEWDGIKNVLDAGVDIGG